jgi:hypothetical protein
MDIGKCRFALIHNENMTHSHVMWMEDIKVLDKSISNLLILKDASLMEEMKPLEELNAQGMGE